MITRRSSSSSIGMNECSNLGGGGGGGCCYHHRMSGYAAVAADVVEEPRPEADRQTEE